ncbi:MAG: hypothetical protein ACI8WB_001253 [Phenylobacterium sp.]|jgi:hypothetical protein
MDYTKLDSEQIKTLANAIQIYEAFHAERQQASSHQGSMHWKNIKGKDYLYKGFTGGRNQSLGVRSDDTEQIKQNFEHASAAHKTRLEKLSEQVKRHSGFIKAVRLNRFPTVGARVIRALEQQGIPHRIIGTNALYAYEISAGIQFMPEYIATEDIDVIFDARQSLQIATKLKTSQLMTLLQKADQSFQKVSTARFTFTAANNAGYRVDFITQGNLDPLKPDAFEQLLDEDDIKPVTINSLKWHVASPRFREIVFDQQGFPLTLETVDPRAFILHKWYVSQQDDRRPYKAQRDAAQAKIMATVLAKELTHLPPAPAIQKLFPNAVIDNTTSALDDFSF